MRNKEQLTGFLLDHAAQRTVSFHMPGHKGSGLYRRFGYDGFLNQMMDCDITEIPGADNLFQPEGVLRSTMDRYRRLYDSRESYLLVNGSSCGLVAAVMASVPAGGRLILARNCHKAVYNALSLAGAQPVYAFPEMLPEYGITGEIRPEEVRRCVAAAPDVSAVLIPSPNYYGICSDISAIAEIVHDAGMTLIVDQAHGAHLKFFDENRRADGRCLMAAENLGADIVINSIHKTLAAFTEAALCNVMSDRVDSDELEDALQKMESTSPSYLLMASLDINADLLEKHGGELVDDWRKELELFYDRAVSIDGLRVMTHSRLDDSKINLDMSRRGLNGYELEQELRKRGILAELITGNLVMCMSGIGNRRNDYERLYEALREIAEPENAAAPACDRAEPENAAARACDEDETERRNGMAVEAPPWPDQSFVLHPVPRKRVRTPIDDAAGRVCAQAIIPYPPGIPVICPGEEITEEIVTYAKTLRALGQNVMGIDGDGCVLVGV
ncbi:hypothetical protein BHK98_10035 [Hornefia porci]|uniref:Arginine decarboxylase n=1 Tax=Hornefia porci TaxID=2652292 RepID=A0A1Q9JJR3_9FIRM|nr:DegT/DnrJ/EryC1/StrS family aminotransferase [Hornefia porci]OLR56377.1 hypothetical protein BHK98_10035 [Hornefia porci]